MEPVDAPANKDATHEDVLAPPDLGLAQAVEGKPRFVWMSRTV